MSLYELLACPACQEPISGPHNDQLTCVSCGRQFPIVAGVPVMLLSPEAALTAHEHELPVRPGYARWKERIILKSLTDSQVALDFGAGNQELNDPCIIRMDIMHGPHVDVVGDVHASPFRAGSIDFAFGGAVMEHLPRPHVAAAEIHRVLKPGGLVYADWNFLIAYHGYPHHYFNATIHGIRETFRQFIELELGVGPYHGAAFALRSILETYLRHFQPTTLLEKEFAERMQQLLWFPLDAFDKRIPPEDRFRVAVSGYIVAAKQETATASIIPEPVRSAWAASGDLKARFPQPLNLSVTDNLMAWAKSEGRTARPEIGEYLAQLPRFSKHGRDSAWDRSVVDSWPWELMDEVDRPPDSESHRWALWFARPLSGRLRECWRAAGVLGVARSMWWSLKRTGQQLLHRVGRALSQQ